MIEDLDDLYSFAGRGIGMTDWFVVTQERIQQFAEAPEARQWIHVDRERAKRESPYHSAVAHGFLTLSLLSLLMKQAIQIKSGVRMAVNYGLNRVRFPSPVRADTKIRGRFTLLTLKEVSNAFEAVFSVSVESEGAEKPCCAAEWIVRYYR